MVPREIPGEVMELSPVLWRLSRRLRGRMFHGTRSCSQRIEPFSRFSERDVLCDRCSELHEQTLMVATKRLRPLLATHPSAERLHKRAHKGWEGWTLDARRELDAERGLATRLDRLPTTKWFVAAVPDPLDQRLVIDVLHFARSGDVSDARFGLPISRLAGRYGLGIAEAAIRSAKAIEALRSTEPEWVDRNLDRPLSER